MVVGHGMRDESHYYTRCRRFGTNRDWHGFGNLKNPFRIFLPVALVTRVVCTVDAFGVEVYELKYQGVEINRQLGQHGIGDRE